MQPLTRAPLVFAVALSASLLLCGGCDSAAPAASPASSPTDSGGQFAPNPEICAPSHGLRSALRTRGTAATQQPLDQVEAALALAGYVAVTRTDDLGLPAAIAAVDERGDLVVVTAGGDLAVASSCALDGLGQVHRLDDALARLATATRGTTAATHTLATRAWVLPVGIFGAGRYWRQALPAGLDLNAATDGTLAVTADAQLGFVFAGASHPDGAEGDVVGVQSLSLDGQSLIADDTRIVQGPAALRWQLPDQVAGSASVALQLLVTDASLRWQVGTWVPYVEAYFPGDSQDAPSLAFTVQGGLPGVIRVARAMTEVDLPAALTALRAR